MKKSPVFELITAHIIKNLYSAFPVSASFSSMKIAREFKSDVLDEMQLINIASATFNWLSENGYLVIGSQDLNDYFDVNLTEVCLAALITNKRSDEISIANGLLGNEAEQVDAIERLILIKASL